MKTAKSISTLSISKGFYLAILIILLSFIKANTSSSKLKTSTKTNNKDLIGNNSSDDTQKEYLAYSDYKCVFKCKSNENSVNDLKQQYMNLLNNKQEISLSDITQTDIDFYCSNVKPLYIVKLTPDIETLEDANEKCSEGSDIYQKAVEYCIKSNDCANVTVEVQ